MARRALSTVTLPGRLLRPWHALIPGYGGHQVAAAAGAGLGKVALMWSLAVFSVTGSVLAMVLAGRLRSTGVIVSASRVVRP